MKKKMSTSIDNIECETPIENPIRENEIENREEAERLMPSANNIVAKPIFSIGEIIWAKIKGFVCWPAKIVQITSRRALVFWLNDYRTTNLYLTKVFKFLPHFDEHSKKFSDHIGLECTAREGLILYGQRLYAKN